MTQPEKQDMITHSVLIAAPRQQVFRLVSQPGWWLGNEDPPVYTVLSQAAETTVLQHPDYGQFTFVTRGIDEPNRATFLWGAGEPDGNTEVGRTVVEFWLDERDGETEVTVEETGFSALSMDDEAHAKAIAANTDGWQEELALLKRRAEATTE